MLKRLLLLPLLIVLAYQAQSQFDTSFVKQNILRCADSLVKGFKSRNWEQFALYSNPAIIGSMGGKEEYINYISQTFAGIPDSAWKLYQPGKVLQIIKMPEELQAVIEMHSILEYQGQRITSTACMIGQSWDGGLFWTFFDSQNDSIAVRMIKPDISPSIIIPAKVEKVELLPPPQPAASQKPAVKPKN